MLKRTWLYAIALTAVPFFAGSRAEASEIRDKAGMFSAGAVRKATAELDRAEQRSGVSVVIETIESLPNVAANAPEAARRNAVQELADRRAREIGHEGVYWLISQKDRVYSEPLVKERYASLLPRSTRQAVGNALVSEFKKQRFDDGLLAAVGEMTQSLSSHAAAPAAVPGRRLVPGAAANHGVPDRAPRFGIGSLLFIGLAIFGVLLLFRVIGGMFRGASSMGGGMGGPGYGPGPGPGYGAGPGYGYGGGYGRGGGFFSNMLGGLGGALAGNWLYDQFSGRHGSGHVDASSYMNPGETQYTGIPDDGGDNFVGGDDNGGMGGSWGEAGDAGGGSWGDSGGGGGWFGGGGDSGGSWGGGDGGGDWGGGGGDAGGGW
ncbi:hypothetical protein OJF2_68990 [Aquisphaera giovannonii]|uniref:TPM domain-containing protein n=1 Tax=Aquisphaera giovannonii TaxID=406548 RepID=A0A5B9WEA6_9BACT|nr:TPM domain-containing protein [Aquisphaera giovannonii]QEH38301.1 hypothetical protein OJF2_68990 [Aquisphaera giovannonii]